jgi:hypothetical protein
MGETVTGAISMFVDVKWPFMEKPLVPEQGNNPPEVPNE